LASQLQKTFNAETSLIKGCGGDLDVYVDNVLIFSKKKDGRFPNEGEVERLIKNQS
jgi:predicted Rdx family selenoprotein